MALIRHIQSKKIRSYHAGGGGVGHERDINETRADSACEFCITEHMLLYAN